MSISLPAVAEAAPKHRMKDRIEDRLDRLENPHDEAVIHGRRDIEDRCDRANTCVTPRLDRWERHSWW